MEVSGTQVKETKTVTATRLLLMVSFILGAVMMICAIFRFEPEPLGMMRIAVAVTLFLWLDGFVWAKMRVAARICFALGMVVLLLVLWYNGVHERLTALIYDYVMFIRRYNLYAPVYTDFDMNTTLWLAGAISGLVCNSFVLRHINGPAMLITYLTLMSLPFQLVDVQLYSAAVTLICATLLLYFLLRAYVVQRKKQGTAVSFTPYIAAGAPLCAVIIVVAALMPYPVQENDISEQVLDLLEDAPGFGFFYNRPGMVLNENDSVPLGGANMTPDILLFSVRANTPFYLYTGVYDTYTGYSWDRSGYGSRMDGLPYGIDIENGGVWTLDGYNYLRGILDGRPLRADFSIADYAGALPAGMREEMLVGDAKPLSVLYHRINTGIVMLPRYCNDVQLLQDGTLKVDTDGIVHVEPEAGRDFAYQAWAYQPVYGRISERIKDEKLSLYSEYNHNLISEISVWLSNNEGNTIISGIVMPYIANLALPDSVTERTRELAAELAEPDDSVFDYAMRVQNYLAANYTYSLNAAMPPEGTDFVDWFLFESGEGYCTSYASAMVVLLRSMNVPARYCQGFGLNPDTYRDGIYKVSSRDAHAWVEVKLPEVGWLTFDPTAAGSGAYYRGLQRSVGTSFADNFSIPEEQQQDEDDDEQNFESPSPSPVQSGTENTEETLGTPARLAICLLGVVFFVLAIRLVRKASMYVRRRLARRLPAAYCARFWFKRTLRLLSADKLVLMQSETLEEFSERVKKVRPESAPILEPVVELMQRVYYSRDLLTADDVFFMEHAYRRLGSDLTKSWRKSKIFWEKYATGRLI